MEHPANEVQQIEQASSVICNVCSQYRGNTQRDIAIWTRMKGSKSLSEMAELAKVAYDRLKQQTQNL
jgi:hypothetical protein